MELTSSSVVQLRLGRSNAYLIKGQRPILIDTGSPNETDKILTALRREGVDVRDLALILHTHGHSDHCGSTRALQQLSRAPIAIHRLDADMLRRGINRPLRPTRPTARLLRPFVDKQFEGSAADILIDDELALAAYGIDGRVIHTPGHTLGSITIVLAGGEAIVGDLLMGGHLGGVLQPQRPRDHYFAEDQAALRQSMTRVLHLNPALVYVGHGGPLTRAAVSAWAEHKGVPHAHRRTL